MRRAAPGVRRAVLRLAGRNGDQLAESLASSQPPLSPLPFAAARNDGGQFLTTAIAAPLTTHGHSDGPLAGAGRGDWTHAWGGHCKIWGCDRSASTHEISVRRRLWCGVAAKNKPTEERAAGGDAAGGSESAGGAESNGAPEAVEDNKVGARGRDKGRRRKRAWRGRVPRELALAKHWRALDKYMTANRSRLTADDVRTMWKRAVYTHLDDKGRVLKANAPDATVGGRAFLRGLARETMARREEFDTAQLRDIGWASGRLWFSDAELMAMVKGGLVAALAEGRIPVTETIPVIWALAQSGNYPQEVLDALVEMGGERIGELNAQNCTNLLWAMAFSGYHPGDAFLGLLCDTALARFDDSPKSVIAQTVSDMLWACGRLGHPEPGKVAGRCVDWARPRMGSFTAGELVAAVQGLAMMGALERGDMERACRRFQKLLAKVAMPSVALDRVVALTMLFPGEERAELQGLLFGESRDRLRKEREVWQAEVAHRMRTNSFITSISAQLEELSIYHQVGSVLGGGQLAVELLVEKEGRMHGLVPVHSMSVNRNGGSIVLGEVGLARRLLEAQELPIAGLISMAEWDRCKDDQDVKKRLVQRAVEGG